MIVLPHKVESAHTVALLYMFNKFSSIKLFKPARHHAKRSSFYMIATSLQNQHCEALLAVERWRRQWKAATFRTDEEYKKELRTACLDAEIVLGEFGAELAKLGREVWRIQAKALEKAPFIER